MGTDFTKGAKRADVIAERIAPSADVRCLAHRAIKSILWAVKESANGDRWIECTRLVNSRFGWGSHVMEEGMHPYNYDCPLVFLDMTPVACEAWRAKVREFHIAQEVA